MRYAVETTHAVPLRKAALYLVKTTTLFLCPECHKPLGTYTNARERAILEACHDCNAQVIHTGPMPGEPFN